MFLPMWLTAGEHTLEVTTDTALILDLLALRARYRGIGIIRPRSDCVCGSGNDHYYSEDS